MQLSETHLHKMTHIKHQELGTQVLDVAYVPERDHVRFVNHFYHIRLCQHGICHCPVSMPDCHKSVFYQNG